MKLKVFMGDIKKLLPLLICDYNSSLIGTAYSTLFISTFFLCCSIYTLGFDFCRLIEAETGGNNESTSNPNVLYHANKIT